MGRRKIDDQTESLDFGSGTHTDDATTTAYARPPEKKTAEEVGPNRELRARVRSATEGERTGRCDMLAYVVVRAMAHGAHALAQELCDLGVKTYGARFEYYLGVRNLSPQDVLKNKETFFLDRAGEKE